MYHYSPGLSIFSVRSQACAVESRNDISLLDCDPDLIQVFFYTHTHS